MTARSTIAADFARVMFATALCLLSFYANAHSAHGEGAHTTDQTQSDSDKKSDAIILAPGYQELSYSAPVPGSYHLPPISDAYDAIVRTSTNEISSLYKIMGDDTSLISFIYTQCDDVNGCPLATYVLSQIEKRIRTDKALNNRVQLISISFDPKNDTPERLSKYAASFTSPDSRWEFVTAPDDDNLKSLLADYDQSIVLEPDGNTISHILRVYLVDPKRKIRNVYSVSFLHADTVTNDIKTILAEFDPLPDSAHTVVAQSTLTPGDPRAGYESSEYQTQSKSVAPVIKPKMDLRKHLMTPQLGLPIPDENYPSTEVINLGKRLFFDRRLSLNDTISCAMCHIPEQGFTSNEIRTAVGIEGRSVRRNSPTLLNVAYLDKLFHDGREDDLAQQVWSPLLAKNEMANPSIGFVINKIRSIDGYVAAFAAAFNGAEYKLANDAVNMQTIGQALAAYETALAAGDSPFDQLHYGKKSIANEAQIRRGLELFTHKAACVQCHMIGPEYALFTDSELHNTGIGYANSMGAKPLFREVIVAPGEALEVHKDDIGSSANDHVNDLGQYEITQDPDDRWKYRTPSLRNIALTAPYMHDGSLSTLREVIEFYNHGGAPNPVLDPLIKPLGLNEEEIEDIIAFLNALTSEHIATLVEDARSIPVGERH